MKKREHERELRHGDALSAASEQALKAQLMLEATIQRAKRRSTARS